jgi:DNA ligase-1
MRFALVADTSTAVAATPSRRAKTALLADCVSAAGPDDVEIVVSYLSGELRQRRTGLGPAALRHLPPPAAEPVLEVAEVDAAFAAMSAVSGAGSTAARRALFVDLAGRATAVEQHLLAGLVTGELRQGALGAALADAVAQASGVPAAEVRRAVTVAGSLLPVAAAVLADGSAGLDRFRLAVGTPLRPMLASPSAGIDDAMTTLGRAAVEWKIDGVRVQVHRSHERVWVFTRSLDDITVRVPEIVQAVGALPVTSVVLDGEAIALEPSGRPLPFQRTSARIAQTSGSVAARADVALSVFFFDCLHRDGVDLIGAPAHERWDALAEAAPSSLRVPRVVTAEADEARAFFADAVARGHEGVVAKSLDAAYEAGRRGAAWLKVKPRHTLDLVVLAVEWGHGRRQGLLSNLHLGARDPAGRFGEPGGFVMLGKTFKGLTDAMLRWQTDRFTELAIEDNGWVVRVRPEQVVEVAFDGVQRSTRYPGGVALRFARVLRHRDDKTASEADTIDAVRSFFQAPSPHEGR